jgi:hypothetical protein
MSARNAEEPMQEDGAASAGSMDTGGKLSPPPSLMSMDESSNFQLCNLILDMKLMHVHALQINGFDAASAVSPFSRA